MQSSKLHLLSLSSLPGSTPKQKKLTSRFDNKWLAHFSSDFEFPTNITYFTNGTETGTSTSRCSQFLALKPTTQYERPGQFSFTRPAIARAEKVLFMLRNTASHPSPDRTVPKQSEPLNTILRAVYICVPRNATTRPDNEQCAIYYI